MQLSAAKHQQDEDLEVSRPQNRSGKVAAKVLDEMLQRRSGFAKLRIGSEVAGS
jgi:hypothetical protein